MKKISRSAARRTRDNILCIVVDRLNADFLGAYGATQCETDAFDALACESILFDSYFVDTLDLDALYRGFWRGEQASRIRLYENAEFETNSLFAAFKEQGYRTYLLSDDERVALSSTVESEFCDDRFLLERKERASYAETTEQTQFFHNFEELARFIAKLEDRRLEDSSPWFVWAHFSGMNDIWDFPIAQRAVFQEDETDPAPYGGLTPPFFPKKPKEPNGVARRTTSPSNDADEPRRRLANLEGEALDVAEREYRRLDELEPSDQRQAVVEAYAAGVAVFNETLGGFLALLKEREVLQKTFFVLCGARGFPTGSPSALGISDERDARTAPFYSEEINAPLIMRLPDQTCATTRLPTLCQPQDVFATLKEYPTFANRLRDEQFWALDSVEISPFAGRWSAEAQSSEKKAEIAKDRLSEPEIEDAREGRNLLESLQDETRRARRRVLIVARDASSDERALATDDWLVKASRVANEEDYVDAESDEGNAASNLSIRYELYARPDDRYNINDVADRGRDVVDALAPLMHFEDGDRRSQ